MTDEWADFFRMLDCLVCAFLGGLFVLVLVGVLYSVARRG